MRITHKKSRRKLRTIFFFLNFIKSLESDSSKRFEDANGPGTISGNMTFAKKNDASLGINVLEEEEAVVVRVSLVALVVFFCFYLLLFSNLYLNNIYQG